MKERPRDEFYEVELIKQFQHFWAMYPKVITIDLNSAA